MILSSAADLLIRYWRDFPSLLGGFFGGVPGSDGRAE